MKIISLTTTLLSMFLLIFSTALFAQSHTIVSTDEIVSLTDPVAGTWYESDIDGSLILSWDEGTAGISGGFCDLTAYTPFPNGGKYEVSLISVISSTANDIQGIWQIKKNGTPLTVTMGTAANLTAPIGGQITITIDSYVFILRVSFKIDGVLAPDEISGQAFVNASPLAGGIARIRGGGSLLGELNTDYEGKYNFTIDPDDVKRILVIFKNYDTDIVVSGYIYVAGEPLAGASVTIENQAGVLDTVVTDADGYYQSNHIVGAVGSGLNNIRTIIVK